MKNTPDKFELYRLAVQHPQAEVAFLLKAYAHYVRRRRAAPRPTRLREDFAGTAAIAACWVALDADHRALAVELHGPTLRRARAYTAAVLGPHGYTANLHLVQADARTFRPPAAPRVDLTVALNFSTFIYHTATDLRAYLVGARAGLRPGGLLVLDAYGGPGAMRPGTQRRRIDPARASDLTAADPGAPVAAPFDYIWEQRSYDSVTAHVDCRIHFRCASGRWTRNAFRYSWRLWTLPELTELMLQAGFTRAEVWCDTYDARLRRGDGNYRVVRHMPAREDFVAYVVGLR
jgi:hypothetical protein